MECKTRYKKFTVELHQSNILEFFKFNGTLSFISIEELAKTDYLQKKENQTGIRSVTLTLDAKSFCNI